MLRIALVIAALAVAAPAFAQENEAPGALFVSPVGEPFRASAAHPDPMTAWIAAADSDGDARLSLAEILAGAAAFFPRLDANGDGVVIATESTNFAVDNAPEILTGHVSSAGLEGVRRGLDSPELARAEARIRMRQRQLNARPQGAQGYGLLNDIEPVMSCDRSFDRRVDLEEFRNCAARRFVLIDTNRDGFFAVEDVPAE